MPTRLFPPLFQFEDASGKPASGYTLEFYVTGTSDPKPTYSDAGLTIPNGTITLNALGRSPTAIFATTGAYRIVLKDPDGVVIGDEDPVDGATGATSALGSGIRNLLLNGDFSVSTLGVSSAADAADAIDGWYVLTSTGSVTVARQTLQADGIPSNLRLTQPDASPKRLGIARIIRSADCLHLRGSSVVLSGQIRHSLIAPIRYAILAWTGTADAATRDVVNDWSSSSYEPGDFFISSNLTVVAVGSVTPVGGVFSAVSAISGSVSASMNNLIVFAWTESATAQTATLDPANLQLEAGTSPTAFEYMPVPMQALRVHTREGGPFGWVYLGRQTASSSAQIDFVLPDGFTKYRVEWEGVRPATDGSYLALRTSSNGGSSFDTGGTDYATTLLQSDTTGGDAYTANSTGDLVPLSFGLDNGNAGVSCEGEVSLWAGDGSLQATMRTNSTGVDNASGLLQTFQASSVRRTNLADAVRLLMSSGNISTGRFTLLGRL
jgi:hypothetical protein